MKNSKKKKTKKISEKEKKALFWEEFRRELGERLRPRAQRVVKALVEVSEYLRRAK
jgi:hypothetical protein